MMLSNLVSWFLASVVVASLGDVAKAHDAATENAGVLRDPHLDYASYEPRETDIIIDRAAYLDRLHGFWLGQSIANWTGLITEFDKIGGPGVHGEFYTREDWGGPDQPAIWSDGAPSEISTTIDFVLRGENEVWGADDDTDIEYIYQHTLYAEGVSVLSADQIRNAWLNHIYDETKATPYGFDYVDTTQEKYQNYLWVSNQRAHELMLSGVKPPETSAPEKNPHWNMIDAQLTTEIFGLFSPARPDMALTSAHLPIRVSARENAAWAAEFYVIMHALAPVVDDNLTMAEKVQWLAKQARYHLPDGSYSAAMFDFVKSEYEAGSTWESVRDQLYQKFQVNQENG
ncbi:MAG: ADP-ribosylglycohydrolase family protein, partial [Pseudomonadota bacterium]